jgi:hypothetical protein
MLNRWVIIAISVVMGALQAWDSGVLGAGTVVQLLVGTAIALPVVALLATNSYGMHALAVAGAFVLLTIARVLSPVSLPTLVLVAFIPAVLIFFSQVAQVNAASRAPR